MNLLTNLASARLKSPRAIPRIGAWITLVVALLLTTLVLVPGQAQAQGPQLICAGTGIARAHLSGSIAIGSTGGTIRIYDADTINSEGVGEKFDYGNWTHFIGWIGQISASGNDFNARLVASNISFVAAGQGMTWVRGVGTCTTSTGTTFSWTDDIQAIVIE